MSTDNCKIAREQLACCKTLGIQQHLLCQAAIASLQVGRTVHIADSGHCIGAMRQIICLVAVAALQPLCTPVAALQQSTRVPSVDHSRRQFFSQAAASSLAATALPQVARAANETQPEFDAAAYFGIFSCEGWGQKRMPGSNTCVPK